MSDLHQEIRRCEATNDYSGAFRFCMDNLTNPMEREYAQSEMRRMAKKYTYRVFEKCAGGYRLTISKVLDENWLLDIAIENNYTNIERSRISTGLFSSVPCIVLGSFLAKHKYGWSIDKEKGTTSIYYDCSCFCDDYKMITVICEKIIDMF